MEKKKILILAAAIIVIAACCATYVWLGATGSHPVTDGKNTRIITDALGRQVEIPVNPQRVATTYPPLTTEVYMLAPDKLIGWQTKPLGQYMQPKYTNLPVIGGWYGLWTGNYENFVVQNPDLILINADVGLTTIEDHQARFAPVPVVAVNDTTDELKLEPTIRFMGDILNETEQADELVSFYHRVQQDVAKRVSNVSADTGRRVYYAEGPQGLSTDPKGSWHTQLIEITHAYNVANVQMKPGYGMTPVSMENILQWNPDIIIVENPDFYKIVYNESSWKDIPAVKNHKVYLMPHAPFPWFDRPPGVSCIIGFPWTLNVIYPELATDMDLKGYVREFYSKFYHYDLTDEEVATLLATG